MTSTKKLALVVPSITDGGGVPSVAWFLTQAAVATNRYAVKVISLSSSSSDKSSSLLLTPRSWFRGPLVQALSWHDLRVDHVGAHLGELEFMRFLPRKKLDSLLADVDLVQLVCGSPAWANCIPKNSPPFCMQVATRVKLERRVRDSSNKSLLGLWRKSMTVITNQLDHRGMVIPDLVQTENPIMQAYAEKLRRSRPGGHNVFYAPPGVNTDIFCPSTRTLEDPYILCVGRLDDERKNVGLLFRAFRMVSQSNSRVRLITAGSTPPKMEHLIASKVPLDRYLHIHRPSLAELVKLYQGACCLSLTSDEEGFGVVIIEAMSCGIPVVATRCGGPDGIIDHGTNGFLVGLKDEGSLAGHLLTLCVDSALNMQMGRAARLKAVSHFSIQSASKSFVGHWDSLTGVR